MQRRSRVTSVLLALVLIGAAANLLVFFRYLQVLNTAQRLQGQAQRLQFAANLARQHMTAARALAAETLAFGRKVPAAAELMLAHTNLLQRLDLVPATTNR